MSRVNDLRGNLGRNSSSSTTVSSTSRLPPLQFTPVPPGQVYEHVVRAMIVDYLAEPRFRNPRVLRPVAPVLSQFLQTQLSQARFPSGFFAQLMQALQQVALNKYPVPINDLTRRLLLRFLNDTRLLSVAQCKQMDREYLQKPPENLVVEFVKCAGVALREMLQATGGEQLGPLVFHQTNTFIHMLVRILEARPGHEVVVAKLKIYEDQLKPPPPPGTIEPGATYRFTLPSYMVADMARAPAVMAVFGVLPQELQVDITRLRDYVCETSYVKDLELLLQRYQRDDGAYTPRDFNKTVFYVDWSDQEVRSLKQLVARITPPPQRQNVPQPQPLHESDTHYVLPSNVPNFMYLLLVLCMGTEALREMWDLEDGLESAVGLLPPLAAEVVALAAEYWRSEKAMQACALYSAARSEGNILATEFDPQILWLVLEEVGQQLAAACNPNDECEGDEWLARVPKPVAAEMDVCLQSSYTVFMEDVRLCTPRFLQPAKTNAKLRDDLHAMVSLYGLIRNNPMFTGVQLGLCRRWERRVSKKAVDVLIPLYRKFVDKLLAESSVSLEHVHAFFQRIVDYVVMIKQRFDGTDYFGVPVVWITYECMTDLLGEHSSASLSHVRRNKEMDAALAVDCFYLLDNMRHLRRQAIQAVAGEDDGFGFNIEEFFFPYVQQKMALELRLLNQCVDNAVAQEDYRPLGHDVQYSGSVKTVWDMVGTIRNSFQLVGWQDELQLAVLATQVVNGVMQAISRYGDLMYNLIELDLALVGSLSSPIASKHRIKNWFDEVAGVVRGMNELGVSRRDPGLETPRDGGEVLHQVLPMYEEDLSAFRTRTGVALVNIQTMVDKLGDLEREFDTERVLRTLELRQPAAARQPTSHVVTLKVTRADQLRVQGLPNPYVVLRHDDNGAMLGSTKVAAENPFPEWDEEFEIVFPAKGLLTVVATVWDKRLLGEQVLGSATVSIVPQRLRGDGTPQQMLVPLMLRGLQNKQGELELEVTMESVRDDPIFAMGKARRQLLRQVDRAIKLIVAKFTTQVEATFLRHNLASVCGDKGQLLPSDDVKNQALVVFFDYLGASLATLDELLTKPLLIKAMLEVWLVILGSADALLLPPLLLAVRAVRSGDGGGTLELSTMLRFTNMMSSLTNQRLVPGYGRVLTQLEMETVMFWLQDCKDSFHQDGQGPDLAALKNNRYQALLVAMASHDEDGQELKQQVQQLAPLFARLLRDRHAGSEAGTAGVAGPGGRRLSRVSSMARSRTIMAHGTARARQRAVLDEVESRHDPVVQDVEREDVLLRTLVARGENEYVAHRLHERRLLQQLVIQEKTVRQAMQGRR